MYNAECDIFIFSSLPELDRPYTYAVREGINIFPGCVAAVPFGRSNNPAFGVVTEIRNVSSEDEINQNDKINLKDVLYTLDPIYSLSEI